MHLSVCNYSRILIYRRRRRGAIYRAEEENDKQKRLETRQNSSFKWFTEEDSDSVSSVVMVSEDAPVELYEETNRKPRKTINPKPRRKMYVENEISDKNFFELEKQLLLDKKRKELEKKLGIVESKEEDNKKVEKNTEIIIGKQQTKGFYGLQADQSVYRSEIRALVHGEQPALAPRIAGPTVL